MRWRLTLLSLLFWLSPLAALAHGLAPILVRVQESSPGQVRVRWVLSTSGTGLGLAADGTPLTLRLPEHCQSAARAAPPVEPRFRTRDARFVCDRPLRGETLVVEGLPLSRQPVVLRYQGPEGGEWVRTLSGSDDRLELPAPGAAPVGAFAGLARYLGLGVEHILSGWDHLAFVLCLAVVAGGARRLLWAVSAFTLAHSLTLVLGVLGLLRLPGPPVEACIALSVLFMAARAARGPAASSSLLELAGAAFGFGLLHGLGFAGALADVGFRGVPLLAGLLGFNLGVELGQLAVLCGLALALAVLVRVRPMRDAELRARRAAVELSGVAAGYWLITRLLSLAPA